MSPIRLAAPRALLAVALLSISVGAAAGAALLQSYSAQQFRLSSEWHDLVSDAYGVNVAGWTAVTAVVPAMFPNDADAFTRDPKAEIANCDAQIERFATLAKALRDDSAPTASAFVVAMRSARQLLWAGRGEEASGAMAGSTSALSTFAVEVDEAADRHGIEADIVNTYTMFASAALYVSAIGTIGFFVWRHNRVQVRMDRARARRDVLRRSEARFRSLVQRSTDMIAVLDDQLIFSYVSPAAESVLHTPSDHLVGRSVLSVIHPDDVTAVQTLLSEVGARPQFTASIETRLPDDDDGVESHVEIVCTNHTDDLDVAGLILNIRDVSERRAMEKQLRHQAFHDPLTELANRLRFLERLEYALVRGRHGDRRSSISVLYLDLDHFKNVNDELGHSAGDRLLKEVGERILACVGATDTVARLGGDEFAILLENASTGDEARAVAANLLETLSKPVLLLSKELFLSASIGIVVADCLTMSPEDVMRDARRRHVRCKGTRSRHGASL